MQAGESRAGHVAGVTALSSRRRRRLVAASGDDGEVHGYAFSPVGN
jgi:hypothetical protein